MAGRFKVEAIFKGIDKITAPVTRIQNTMGKVTRGISGGLNKINRSVDGMMGGIRRWGFKTVLVLGAVGAAMGNIMSTGARFEQQIINATAKIDGLSKKTGTFQIALKQLSIQARETGRTTEFTATQSAMALNELTTAGLKTQQAIAALPGVVDLATISEGELADAADIATGALEAFGLKVKDPIKLTKNLARINDVLAKTATTSKTKVSDLAETLKFAGAAAAATGADIETFGAISGFMAKGMIRGSMAGTAMRNMMLKLAAPSATAEKIFRKWKISLADDKGDLRDIADIFGDLEPQMKKLGTKKQAAILKEMFGQRGFAGAAIILQKGVKAFREYREVLRQANGTSKIMADTMRDNVAGSFKKVASAIEGVKIAIFEAEKGAFKDILDSMAKWIRGNEKIIAANFGGFFKTIRDNVPTIKLLAKGIVALTVVVGALIVVLKVLTVVMWAVNLAMALNPVGAIVLALAVLVIMIVAVITTVALFHKEIDEWWDSLSTFERGLITIISPLVVLMAFASKVINRWKPVKEFFTTMWSPVKGRLDWIVNEFEFAFKHIGELWDKFMGGQFKAVQKVAQFLGIVKVDKDEGIDNVSGAAPISAAAAGGAAVGDQRRGGDTTTTNKSELTIKDETGRAELTSAAFVGLKLLSTGAF